jgi:hypothetical protein
VSRSAHTYRLGDVEVVLTVPEGIRVPRVLTLRQTDGGHVVEFEHSGVKALRAPVKRKPRQASPLTKMTEDWVPPADAVEKIRGSVPSVNIEFESEQYRDWAISKGEGRADWVAGWRTWLRRTHKTNVERGWKPTGKPRADESPREKWIRTHGLTVAEYEAKKGDKEWVAMIERRGVVA